MIKNFTDKLVKIKFLVFGLLWILLWLLPWQGWIHSNWLTLILSLGIFAVPGLVFSIFLVNKKLSLLAHFTTGIGISVFIVTLLGLVGRILQLPFYYIRIVFVLFGLASLIAVHKLSQSDNELVKPHRISIFTVLLFFAMVAFGASMNFLISRYGGDDVSYLAYLTNWQYAQPLNFNEVAFGLGTRDAFRFWLAMFPMVTAFIAQTSNIAGLLLIGFYLEPVLIAVALLAAYNLFEELLQSQSRAIVALLLHFTFFFLLLSSRQPGVIFFGRLSEDKVFAAFILAPAFFLATLIFKQSFSYRSGILFTFIGLSISLVHPIILAYSIFIVGVYMFVNTILGKEYKKLGVTVLLILVLLSPSAPLRFVTTKASPKGYTLDNVLTGRGKNIVKSRITVIENTPFYGFKQELIKINIPARLQNPVTVFFTWSYLWLMVLGFIWSLFNLKRKPVAPFMLATSLLVLICFVPYTGWLVGYFVTARMIWRSPWLFPAGLFGVVLIGELFRFIVRSISLHISPRLSNKWEGLGLLSLLSLYLLAFFSLSINTSRWTKLQGLSDYREKLVSYVKLGDYLQNNFPSPVRFISSQSVMNYLPGISSKAKVASFRNEKYSENYFYAEAASAKDIDIIMSTSPSYTLERRLAILSEYNIQYILARAQRHTMFYKAHPQYFDLMQVEGFWIIKVIAD